MKDVKFRHELKYLINSNNMELLKLRLKLFMEPDSNAVNGKYKIRSLYFDDYCNSAYNEKKMGVHDRRKYRIRIYDDSDAIIKLECKRKVDSYINKTSVALTRVETQKIINGEYGFLLEKENSMCNEFYYQCVSRFMRPRVIVDYERQPFVFPAGDVRVTFDTNVRTANPCGDFFSPDLPSQYILENGKSIMEVKYTEFMPNIIKRLLPCGEAECVAMSKFTQCYEKTNYMFLEDHSGI